MLVLGLAPNATGRFAGGRAGHPRRPLVGSQSGSFRYDQDFQRQSLAKASFYESFNNINIIRSLSSLYDGGFKPLDMGASCALL